MTAVAFTDVAKSFRRHSGRELIRKHLTRWARHGRGERFYALRDVSFEIEHGEGVGIIGANGAGKSTLLSLMTGLAKPDSGRVQVDGRIGALLQLGAGFHPDLTGIENVQLNAALLGMGRRRTAELLDSIVEFSGVGDFIAEPLRTYSSGMIVRLAFAVAVHMDPDVLIIDEVLAVGDQAFQAKCVERIVEFKRSGKTLVCVSHSGGMIRKLCGRAIWLDHGRVMLDGPAEDVLAGYEGRHG